MIEILKTEVFDEWLKGLRDRGAASRIIDRIERLAEANFGDCRSVGNGVSELRFKFGPGYRIYFRRTGDTIVILLCGGDKSSQRRDIAKAKAMTWE
jgi:putative addiction module killer protein